MIGPQTLAPNTVQSSDEVLTGTTQGQKSDVKSVLSNEEQSFKQELSRIHGAILNDLQNLKTARDVKLNNKPVCWSDTRGNKGIKGIRQIFRNIKHNARVLLRSNSRKINEAEENALQDLQKHMKEMEDMLESVDADSYNAFEAFYNELRGQRPGGYLAKKEKLMSLIGNDNKDKSLKDDVELFLQGGISGDGKKIDSVALTNRLLNSLLEVKHTPSKEETQGASATTDPKAAAEAKAKGEEFYNLLESYKKNLLQEVPGNKIIRSFENELRSEAMEKECRDIDAQRDKLIKDIETLVAPASDGGLKQGNMKKLRLEAMIKKKEEICIPFGKNKKFIKEIQHSKKEIKRFDKEIKRLQDEIKTEASDRKTYKEKIFTGSNMARMEFDDYQTDYVIDGKTDGGVGRIEHRIREEFQKAFPNANKRQFELLLNGVSSLLAKPKELLRRRRKTLIS